MKHPIRTFSLFAALLLIGRGALAQEDFASPIGEGAGQIDGALVGGGPVGYGDGQINGPMVYGGDVGDGPVGGPMIGGGDVGNAPIGGAMVGGAPAGEDDGPIGGDTLY
ncbi:MAG: hypothetical protein ABI629_03045 [bacterium]